MHKIKNIFPMIYDFENLFNAYKAGIKCKMSVVAIPESNIADRDIASVTDAKSVDGLRIGKIFWRSGFIQLTDRKSVV